MIRTFTIVIAGAAGLIAVLLLTDRDEPTRTATMLLTTMFLGSIAFMLGVILWRGRVALALRSIGWLLIVGAAAVPSTLTLALPLLAVLSLALSPGARTNDGRSIPAHVAR
jgi:hypothetical protein